jgi:hypothetical protein
MNVRVMKAQERLAGCSKWPSSEAAASEEARRTLRYVEPLSDARTKLADIFSILLDLKMFAQGQTLALIRGSEGRTIELTRACEHPVVYNLEKCLPIMDQERHVVGADFQDHLGAVQLAAAVPKSRIEKPGVVGPEFTASGFEGDHFGRVAGGDTNSFF